MATLISTLSICKQCMRGFGLTLRCLPITAAITGLAVFLGAYRVCMAEPIAERPPSARLALKLKQNKVYSGLDMTIAVREDGSVWTWGSNYHGRLARLPEHPRPFEDLLPGQVPGLGNIQSVAFDYFVALALDREGRVWSWGDNGAGQLGYETSAKNSSVPRLVPGMGKVAEVVAAPGVSLFLLKDGTVWGVGNNMGGVLGAASRESRVPLRRIEGIPPMRRVAAGGGIVAGIDEHGQLWTWGALGELSGRPNAVTSYERTPRGSYIFAQKGGTIFTEPGIVPLPKKVVDVVVSDAVVVLLEDGTVWSWGWARRGEIGRPVIGDGSVDPVPARIPVQSRVVQIASAFHSFTALTEDGRILAWGAGADAPTPPAPLPPTQARAPILIKDSLQVMQLTSGGWGYLDDQGNWWSWGGNRYGTRGTGEKMVSCTAGGNCDKGLYLTPERARWNFFLRPAGE